MAVNFKMCERCGNAMSAQGNHWYCPHCGYTAY